MVNGLTQRYSRVEPMMQSAPENRRVCRFPNSPLAVGRQAVRFILASMPFSTMQLKAAAAPATSQMPRQATRASLTWAHEGTPGTASTMPISAQNTINWITRGLVKA